MPIESSGEVRLRGTAGDSRTDINEEVNSNATDTNVSLGTLNETAFTNVSDGSVITGRAMSEMRGYSAFTSALPQTEATGALAESLLLDGTNYTFHRTPSLATNKSTFTYSGWYKFNNLDSGNIIIMESGTTSGNHYISLRIDNTNNNIYGLISGSPAPWDVRSPQLFFDTSSWFHFVFAVDTTVDYLNDRLKVYVNGIEINLTYSANSVTQNQTFAINDGSSRISIGRTARTDQYAQFGQTVVADAKFIDGKQLRPDSFGEFVQGVWIPKAFNTPSTDTTVTSGLIADYQFNGDANDTSGSATTYNGTPSNVTFLNNNYGSLQIAGSSDKVDFSGYSHSMFSNATVSVSTWVNVQTLASTSQAGSHIFMGQGNWQIQITNSSTDGIYFTKYHGGSGGNNGTNAATYVPTGGVKTGVWYHIVAVDDTPNGNGIKLYVDGNLVGQNTGYTQCDSNNWVAGIANYSGRTGGNYVIGETKVFTSALTASDVLQEHNATKHKYAYGLNGFWLPLNNTSIGSIDSGSNLKLHLDASDSTSYTGSGTNFNDLTSNNNDGTISGANFLSSTNGGVFSFDGSNDKIDTNTAFTSLVGSSTSYTICSWIYPTSNSSGRPFGAENFNDGFITQTSNGNIRAGGGNGSFGYTSYYSCAINQWHHICLAITTNSSLELYIDGVLKETRSITITFSGSARLFLGADFHSSTLEGPFTGSIAQARVYDKVLTAQEVVTDYRATQGNYQQLSAVDISGNVNHFTSTNIDYTDHLRDEPLDNYPIMRTFNNVFGYSTIANPVQTNGGKQLRGNEGGFISDFAANTGKWYWEIEVISTNSYHPFLGVTSRYDSRYDTLGQTSVSTAVAFSKYGSNSASNMSSPDVAFNTSGGYGVTAGTIISFKLDLDAGNLYMLSNNVLKATDTGIPSDGSQFFHALVGFSNDGASGANWSEVYINFGQKEFSYPPTVSSGYKTFGTKNLPAPAFDPNGTTPDKPSNHFKALIYQGNGGTQAVRGLGFQPDFTWIHPRNAGADHTLTDSVRGVSKILSSNTLAAEGNQSPNGLIAFGIDGFTVKDVSSGGAGVNGTSGGSNAGTPPDYVSWNWYAPTSEPNNTSGTITTTIKKNVDAGFSIVKYTGNGAGNTSFGTGLTSEAKFIIFKRYTNSQNWFVFVKINNVWHYFEGLNNTNAAINYANYMSATSTTVNLPSYAEFSQDTSSSYIAYCFHSVDGYSKIGSYTGNSSAANSPFVYTGFKPAFVMIKNSTSGSTSWVMADSRRGYADLYANDGGAEYSSGSALGAHFLSNGFTLATADISRNASNNTYIYMAIAEDPDKYSNGVADLFDGNEFIEGGNYPEDNFKTVIYTGNSSTNAITGIGFQPDLIWIKQRNSGARNHNLNDSVRGASSNIFSDSTYYATTNNQGFGSFDSDGFTLNNTGSDGGGNTNINNVNHVAWIWKAGGAPTATNSAGANNSPTTGSVMINGSQSTAALTGSIVAKKISANTASGFSIVQWEGTVTTGTIDHCLSSTPELILTKNIDTAANDGWPVFTTFTGNGKFLQLNTSSNALSSTGTWNQTDPNNTVFTVNNNAANNKDGDNIIAYCFHSVPGYSKIGRYEGTGSSREVYLGFEPRFLMIKNYTNTGSTGWVILDTARDTLANNGNALFASSSGSEWGASNTTIKINFTATGFTINDGYVVVNGGSDSYLYMAFAHR